MHKLASGRKSTKKSVKLDICVRNPITHNTWEDGRYTDYEIAVQTNHKAFCLESSTTRRRYSEFEWLKKRLKNHHPLIKPPSLPPKKFFGERFDPDFIAFRKKGLEDYLHVLIREKLYLSDVCLHLFLQTDLTVEEIDDYLNGKIPSEVIEMLWKVGGVKANCSHFTPQENREFEASVSSIHTSTTETSDTDEDDDERRHGDNEKCDENQESTSSSESSQEAYFPPVSMVSQGQIQISDGQGKSGKKSSNFSSDQTSKERGNSPGKTNDSSSACARPVVANKILKVTQQDSGISSSEEVSEVDRPEIPRLCDIRDSIVFAGQESSDYYRKLSINGDL